MKKDYIITTVVVVVIALGVFLYYFFSSGGGVTNIKKGVAPTPTLIPTTIPATPTLSPVPAAPKVQTGTIEGSLGYPSEGIPGDMIICAEDTQIKKNHCTSEHLKNPKYTYGLGYKIEVPVGSYLVYATIPDYQGGYRAYYSEFVTCGLSINCPSHKPIVVSVSAGESAGGIDPIDWYAQ